MGVFLEKSCMYAGLLRTIMYALIFFFWGKIKCCWVSLGDYWVFFYASEFCIHSCFWPETSFSLIFENVLVISFSTFCLGISALGLFYLGALLGCCLWVVVESEGGKVIFLLFISFNSKIQKHFYFCIVMHCLHFALAWYLN